MENFPKIDLFPRLTKATGMARSAIRFTFEHFPSSDFGRSEHQSFDAGTVPFENRWDDMGTYYEGDIAFLEEQEEYLRDHGEN